MTSRTGPTAEQAALQALGKVGRSAWSTSIKRTMAGLIKLKEQQWSVAGWVFDHVLRLARQHLPRERSVRILNLIDESATGWNHISLDNLSPAELSTFHQALEQAYLQIERQAGGSFSTPEFYSGFMDRFHELLEMIRSSDKIPKKN